jgi:hypothetical protein
MLQIEAFDVGIGAPKKVEIRFLLDTNAPPQRAKVFAERIPGCRLPMYPGEGHISILDRPIKEIVETLLVT